MRRINGLAARLISISSLLAVCGVSVSTGGCSRQLLSVVFDVPENEQRPSPRDTAVVRTINADAFVFVQDTVRPPIEDTLDPDTVLAMLPRDNAGNADWVAAMRQGIIKPRASHDSSVPADFPGRFTFGFDFMLPGPTPMLDAYFPHSVHTEIIECAQCHPRTFRFKNNEIQMADVLSGKFCGECHGPVAFSPPQACERCHVDFPQPPNRVQPALLGTFRLRRSQNAREPDTVAALASVPAPAETSLGEDSLGVTTNPSRKIVLPEAIFPHWVHRIRFKCSVCHMSIFEPERGANEITMAQIDAGQACGTCHNGKTAFVAGFENCYRCHKIDESIPGSE